MNGYVKNCLIILLLSAPAHLIANAVLLYNNASWPIFVWPIPAKNPPYLLAKVPNRQSGVITAPAKLEWPGDAVAMIIIAEKHAELFQKIVNDTIADYTSRGKPAGYDWASKIRYTLFNMRVLQTEWAVFYPRGSGMGNEILLEKFTNYRLVVYNAPAGRSLGNLTGIAEPLDWNSGLENRFGI